MIKRKSSFDTNLDFLKIAKRDLRTGITELYPKFVINDESKDLMIRGSDFYAIWIADRELWSTKEQDVIRLVDRELNRVADEYFSDYDNQIQKLYMWDGDSKMIDKWHKYCQKQCRDHYNDLDEKLIFSNTETKKEDYASKRLKYPLESCAIPAYDKLMSTLYSEEERNKIEWAIGSIVAGDSKSIQKFLVFYGAAGTGKSTVLNIIQQLFDGYYSVFDAKALGSTSNVFALEAFNSNPLVAIQHDGDLSRIEDNTRLNSLVSHERMTVNEKFKSTYSTSFNAFLFMGTNKPVKITDARSGLLRRLIDVRPTGNKVSSTEYRKLVKQIKFELGGIASHCLDVYTSDKHRYDAYVPTLMLDASNDFYNFISDYFNDFKSQGDVSLAMAYEWYTKYCDEAKVGYPLNRRSFKEELKNYFEDYKDRYTLADGTRVRSCFVGFLEDKFSSDYISKEVETLESWLNFDCDKSILDTDCSDMFAQLANDDEKPRKAWDKVTTKLSNLDTSKVHYVRLPENHIVIDFDIPDEKGNKSYEKNLEAASKWPPTYAELSKSGSGIHLHYIYTGGDPSKLSRIYDDSGKIEVKVFTGKSSLRRKLTKCNNIPIATLNSGLPLKEEKMINKQTELTVGWLRYKIKQCLNKEVHAGTKPNVDYIYKLLTDAYNQGLTYDLTEMKPYVITFAANSTHHAQYCLSLVAKMPFKSEVELASTDDRPGEYVFFDVEVFVNFFLLSYKFAGENNKVFHLFDPSPEEVKLLFDRHKMIGFNNRRYDNHICYARMLGYTNEQLYNLSQKIISGDNGRNALFGSAYNLSYTDIYDFASAGNKKSLKKLEIEMGISHKELGMPWDQPVPEDKKQLVADYCENDVIATEAAFNYLSADWIARQILADLANGSVNDTTNSLTTKFIFGNDRSPQKDFFYRDLSQPVFEMDPKQKEFLERVKPEMMAVRHGPAKSLLPYFPGYKYDHGVSTYMDFSPENPDPLYHKVGEGGCVYSEVGDRYWVALLDIASQHPNSILSECLFGSYTNRFNDVVSARLFIKHEDWESLSTLLDGKLVPYIQKVKNGEMESSDLANALKTAINSVYGLTSASFANAFKDPRNKDNIVAKRGALFMIQLKHEVEQRGFTVAHIKTDSIKIPMATPEIINFVMDFGKRYGYDFEHEATYEKMCLVNKAVYIAKYASKEDCERLYGYCPGKNAKKGGKWDATGTQFAVPYVFKTLFSREPIIFKDLCETFAVSKGDLYLDMNEKLPDVSDQERALDKLETKYKKGQVSDIIFERDYNDLKGAIASGHKDIFVGRVGQFCPVVSGTGGGILNRIHEGKRYAASGSSGYRWLESETVKTLNLESKIDFSFYRKLTDEAADAISEFVDFEWFVSDEKPKFIPPFMNIPEGIDEEVPWD